MLCVCSLSVFLGDVAIGVVATELRHKDCEIKAFCVLPYFRNFGCGMCLYLNLRSMYISQAPSHAVTLLAFRFTIDGAFGKRSGEEKESQFIIGDDRFGK